MPVANDHVLVRDSFKLLVSGILKTATIVEAGDGDSLVRAVRTHAPVSLALVDLNMPGMERGARLVNIAHANPLLREALKTMGRADLIGNGKHHLIPTFQPLGDSGYQSARKKNSTVAAKPQQPAKTSQPVKGRILTQHTGLPPRRQK